MGVSAERLVREALVYYVSDLGSERLAARPPRGGAEASGRFQRQELELCVDVDRRTWEALERQAAGYEIPLEQLVGHAALYYLADLGAGRVAARIVDGLDKDARS
jgi:hypothetical protein